MSKEWDAIEKADFYADDITKVAIERSLQPGEPLPWHMWGRNYKTGEITEEIYAYGTFQEAIAAVPEFFAMIRQTGA